MRVVKLIPVDDKSVEKVEALMNENVMFNNVEQFITLFNMKVLDQRNPIISDVAQELIKAFRNLTLLNGRFVVETPTETAIKTSIKLLKDWEVLIKLKRVATLLLDENYPLDTKIVFTSQSQGKPFVTVVDPDTNEIKLEAFWASDKVVTKNQNFANNIFTMSLLKSYDEDGDSCYFEIPDLVDIDDSFILEIESILKENSLKA